MKKEYETPEVEIIELGNDAAAPGDTCTADY